MILYSVIVAVAVTLLHCGIDRGHSHEIYNVAHRSIDTDEVYRTVDMASFTFFYISHCYFMALFLNESKIASNNCIFINFFITLYL